MKSIAIFIVISIETLFLLFSTNQELVTYNSIIQPLKPTIPKNYQLPEKYGKYKHCGTLKIDVSVKDLMIEVYEDGILNLHNKGFEELRTIEGSLDCGVQEVNLSFNKLYTLPIPLNGFPNLKKLDCSNNEITYIPHGFFALKSLEVLDLSHNQFRKSFPSLLPLPKLVELNLSHNPDLEVIPSNIGYLKHLKTLNIVGTKLAEDEVEMKKLKEILPLTTIVYQQPTVCFPSGSNRKFF